MLVLIWPGTSCLNGKEACLFWSGNYPNTYWASGRSGLKAARAKMCMSYF